MTEPTNTLILLTLAVLSLMFGFGALFLVRRRQRLRVEAWEQFAWQNGWHFQPDDPALLAQLAGLVVPAQGSFTAVLQRRVREARLYFFLIDRTNDIFAPQGKNETKPTEAGLLIEDAALDLPPFLLMTMDKVPRLMRGTWKFVLPDLPRLSWDDMPEFEETIWVLASAEADTAVRDFLTPARRQALLRWAEMYPPPNKFMAVVQGHGRSLVLHNPNQQIRPEQLEQFTEMGTAVYEIFSPANSLDSW